MIKYCFPFIIAFSLFFFACGEPNTDTKPNPQESESNAANIEKQHIENTEKETLDLKVQDKEKNLEKNESEIKEEPKTSSNLETELEIKKPVIVEVDAKETHVPEIKEIDKITSDVKNYTKSLNDRRFNDAIGFVNPEVFKISSKEMLMSAFKLMEAMDIKSRLVAVDSISEIIDIEQDEFCKVYFKNYIDMAIPPESKENPKLLMDALKASGAEDVVYNFETKRLTMDRNAVLLAAKYGTQSDWKYLDLDGRSFENYGSIFPEEVQNELLR